MLNYDSLQYLMMLLFLSSSSKIWLLFLSSEFPLFSFSFFVRLSQTDLDSSFFFLEICCWSLFISLSMASISAVDAQHSEVQLGAQNDEHPDWHCPMGGAGATIGVLQQVGVQAGAHVLGQPAEHGIIGG